MEKICSMPLYKELFDPYSDEWSQSDYDVKAVKIQKIRETGNQVLEMNFIARCEMDTKNIDEMEIEEIMSRPYTPLIPLHTKILSTGLYLAKALEPEFRFPQTSGAVTEIDEYLATLTGPRKKRTRQIEDMVQEKNINTREYFDQNSSEYNASTVAEKIEKLAGLASEKLNPLELLYFHYNRYNGKDHYRNIVQDIPDSVMRLYFAAVR